MPPTAAARLKQIRDFALSLPGTQPKSPWPGHDDVAVNDKTFLYLGLHDGEVSVGVNRPSGGGPESPGRGIVWRGQSAENAR